MHTPYPDMSWFGMGLGRGASGSRIQSTELRVSREGLEKNKKQTNRAKNNKQKKTHLKASPIVKVLRKCNPGRRPPEGIQSQVVRERRRFPSREEMHIA